MLKQKATLKCHIQGQPVELIPKSRTDNIYLEDGVTLLSTRLEDTITQESVATDQETNEMLNEVFGGTS